MKHPLINTIWYDKDTNDPRSGTKMLLYHIYDMPYIKENERRRCQLMDSGFRVSSENYKEEYWDNLTYEDIDYKFWIEYWDEIDKSKVIDPFEIYDKVKQYLIDRFVDCIYYSEMSRSCKGFHFLFYFDVPRTKEWRDKCKKLSARIIKTAFIECGYKDIIEFKLNDNSGCVFDDCTNSVYQLCYLTKNKWWLNKCCTGKYIEYDGLCELDKKKDVQTYASNNDDYIIDVDKYELNDDYKVDYINHFERWNLFRSLKNMYPETYEDEWDYCCDHMTEANGHTAEWYKNMTEGRGWDDDESTYIDKDLVKKFGYNVTFIKKTNKKGKINYIDLLKL